MQKCSEKKQHDSNGTLKMTETKKYNQEKILWKMLKYDTSQVNQTMSDSQIVTKGPFIFQRTFTDEGMCSSREDKDEDCGSSYLDVIRCQVSFHVAVLLFGWGRGRLVGGWEVSPVKRVKRQHDTQHREGLPLFTSLTFYSTL